MEEENPDKYWELTGQTLKLKTLNNRVLALSVVLGLWSEVMDFNPLTTKIPIMML